MSRWKTIGIGAVIVLLFLIANRGAYKGYFQDDDLDNLAWTPQLDAIEYLHGLVSPVFSRNNFRPVGHFYFHIMERFAGLRFVPYVAVLQFIHLLNGLLIWLVLRRLKIQRLAALAGVVFFLYHPATFDAYWQPMYVFDVLCGTFCLLSFLAFANRHWVLSFACFVCAYKSKEIAVMLPAVLAAYEFLLGEKKWKPLVPFFLLSASFGVQALVSNANTHDAYTLRVTPATLWDSVRFYLPKFFFINPLVGLLLLAAILTVRDRHISLGILAALLFLVPLLVLPNRMASVYLYVPLAGIAIVMAAFLERAKPWAVPVLLAAWMLFSFTQMRAYRRGALTVADENRSYVEGLAEFLPSAPQTSAFIQDGAPAAMHPWGINGAIRYLSKKPEIQLAEVDTAEAKALLLQPYVAVLSWDPATRRVQITGRAPISPEESYISMQRGMPIWQFGDGWYHRENSYRWIKPYANAKLRRPLGAAQFEVSVNIGPVHIHDVPKVRLEVLIDGVSIGDQEFTAAGWQKRRYSLKPAAPGLVSVEFRTSPEYHPADDSRTLGIPIGGFGFVE